MNVSQGFECELDPADRIVFEVQELDLLLIKMIHNNECGYETLGGILMKVDQINDLIDFLRDKVLPALKSSPENSRNPARPNQPNHQPNHQPSGHTG